MHLVRDRARPFGRALGLFGLWAVAVSASYGIASGESFAAISPPLSSTSASRPLPALRDTDSLFGFSGKLRARLIGDHNGSFAIPKLARLLGDSATRAPGVYAMPDSIAGRPFALITMLPFGTKSEGRIGSYRVGFWPAERRATVSAAYANPHGFIVVTRENQDTYISEHFRLRDFLTKDQRDVWPKYLVLRLELVDKLELVIEDLKERGIPVRRMAVMSGFRTPQYNATGGSTAGRATLSRHMYGDAADVFVDNNGDGRMDDLNGDGRVDHRDAQLLLEAVERVERAYPSLVGGVGLYRANRAHGPFAHIDVRGNRARWGTS